MWVRFIHRLGLHEVASHELLKLAQAQQTRASAGMGIQRVDSQPDRPADGQMLSGLVRVIVHSCLSGAAVWSGESMGSAS